MSLSARKKQKIRRLAATRTIGQIARELHCSQQEVRSVLKTKAADPEHTLRPTIDPQRPARLLLYLFTFLAPLVFLRGIFDFANLPQSAWIQLGILLILAVWFGNGFRVGKIVWRTPSFLLPALVFLAWCGCSLLYAHNRYEGLQPLLHWSACALAGMLTVNLLTRDLYVKQLLTAVGAGGISVAVIGIGQHWGLVTYIPQVVAPAATFANKNMAAQLMVATVPVVIGLYLTSTSNLKKWLWLSGAAVMVIFTFYTETRAAWVALTVGLLLSAGLLWAQRSALAAINPKPHLIRGGIAVLVILLCINISDQGFSWQAGRYISRALSIATNQQPTKATGQDREGTNQKVTSASLRTSIWWNTLEMIKEKPIIGFGLGNHKVFYPLYHHRRVQEQAFSEQAQLVNVHNDYLQTASELGLAGMIPLAWLLWIVGRMFAQGGNQEDRWTILLNAMLAAAVTGILINAFFSFPFQRALPPFLLFILIGVRHCLNRATRPSTKTISGPMVPLMGVLLACGSFLFLLLTYSHWFAADRQYLRLSRFEQFRAWPQVIAAGRQALEDNPLRKKIYSYMGRAYIEDGHPDLAIPVLQRVVNAYPYHMNALLNLGVAYGSTGQFQEALAAYDRVLEIKYDYAKVHNNIANVFMQQNRYDEALEEFKIAGAMDPSNTRVQFNIGIAALKNQKYQDAATAFEQARRLRPDWALVHKNLGILYFQFLNQPARGKKHLRRALELDPNLPDAARIRRILSE